MLAHVLENLAGHLGVALVVHTRNKQTPEEQPLADARVSGVITTQLWILKRKRMSLDNHTKMRLTENGKTNSQNPSRWTRNVVRTLSFLRVENLKRHSRH